jgi:putative ABC transport system ATP-binding protein
MSDDFTILMDNVCKTYPDGAGSITAVLIDRLLIESGRLTAVTGPSGAGKTTFLNVLGGIEVPDKGDIFHGDVKISEMNEKSLCAYRAENLGLMLQKDYLLEHLTVLENLVFTSFMAGQFSDFRKAELKAEKLLGEFDLHTQAFRLPSKISSGERQRAALARALMGDPLLVLADEPTARLDSALSKKIIDALLALADQGRTVVAATHDKNLIERADSVIRLFDGRIETEVNIDQSAQ